MNPAFLQNEIVTALCWTLIHSLWQGMLLAIVTGLVLVATKRSHARKRYSVLTLLFFLFMAVTVLSFVRELRLASPAGGSPAVPVDLAQQALTAHVNINQTLPDTINEPGFWERFTNYFNTHASMVVMIWLIIFMARFVKLATNLVYVQRLRSYRVSDPGSEWNEKLEQLISKLAISKPVRLLQSGMVKVPVTMGMFRPVILLPMGLLNHLPPDEIEAILLHELAHIRRSDYFINLLQSIAETVFFFNPALLWVSSMMRDERENCCDDIAISVTNSKTQFINALISFQEYHQAQPSLGLAFPGSRHQLLNRVKRIISNRNKTLNAAEKGILSVGVAIFIMFSFVAAKKAPQHIADKPATVELNRGTQPPVGIGITPKMNKLSAAADTAVPSRGKSGPDMVNRDSVMEKPVVTDRSADLAPLQELKALTDKMQDSRDTLPTDKYTHFSVNVNDDGKTRVMEMNATAKDGKEYRFKKINGEIKELFVNGRSIPETEYKNYQKELDDIEAVYQYKMELGRRKREELRIQRIADADMRRGAMEHKIQIMKEDRQRDMIKRQQDLEMRQRSMEDKRLFQQEERLLREHEKLLKLDKSITLNKDLKLDNKVDLKLELLKDIKEHSDVKKSQDLKLKLDLLEKTHERTHDSLKLDLKLKRLRLDSMKSRVHPDHNISLQKLEKLRERSAEDDARVKASAAVMRNILDDLEKANIKVDSQKGWFALDNEKFIVDGKPMAGNLHDQFKAKYLKPGGWGYYYGAVKVTGRGIFLDNKDVPLSR
ncbi:MAG: M48 family metalloprotease [Chitinophagaceae bacterium]|nr:M48 family metalloprotease [Chitinophagaceae bacterium]